MNNYQIPALHVAGMSCTTQLILGVVLFVLVLCSMRKHSSGYAVAAIISVGASLYLHSLPLAAGAFAVAAVVAAFTICSGKPQQRAQQ
ncbi:hypothetical protein BH10CYA1_BH10CYA1_32760 [soil metagenome]